MQQGIEWRWKFGELSSETFLEFFYELPVGVVLLDEALVIQLATREIERMFGYSRAELTGMPVSALVPDPAIDWQLNRQRGTGPCGWGPRCSQGELLGRRKDGAETPMSIGVSEGRLAKDPVLIASMLDRTEFHEADAARQRLEAQLLHTHKLEAIGQLAAGIAHEINTPTQYITDNTVFLRRAFGDLVNALQGCTEVVEAARHGPVDNELVEQAALALKNTRVGFLVEQLPKAIDQSVEGLERVASIVAAMKEFSHPSQGEKSLVKLETAIETTVTVARNEWKYVAELAMDFDESLPEVPCLRDELNQVILNIVVNAAHAISDVTEGGTTGQGTITVSTAHRPPWAEIQISDTGGGMSPEVRRRIFEPFFTTKEVGRGTGQGLAIARSVIVDKHGGEITVDSQPGQGATFIIRLPLQTEEFEK